MPMEALVAQKISPQKYQNLHYHVYDMLANIPELAILLGTA